MAIKKSVYVCKSCGHEEPKWMGRCTGCGEWNTFKEFVPRPIQKSTSVPVLTGREPSKLSEIETSRSQYRNSTGIPELDRVLGGGLMESSVILIGGEPGIGKSTLMLQLCRDIQGEGISIYISGEETSNQIKMRADRLKVEREELLLYCTSHLESVLDQLEKLSPQLCIIDSIQTLYSERSGSVPGTVAQLKMVTHELTQLCKAKGITLILLAHVTKEGAIAGPKAVEHLVDTVLYFDQNKQGDLRILRPLKNRFGAVDDIGLFTMEETGLCPIINPSEYFLQSRDRTPPAGTVVTAVYEGSRILFAEIQALTVPGKGAVSRIFSDRLESVRISRISAILEKHLGIRFSDQDIYVNVAGGLKISDIACDFALALALYSARTSLPVNPGTIAMGELALSGEIRRVSHSSRRIKACREMGFENILISPTSEEENRIKGIILTEDIARGVAFAFTSDQAGQEDRAQQETFR